MQTECIGGGDGWEGGPGQGAMCGSEEGRVRDSDQDGEIEARLGGVVSVRSCDRVITIGGTFWRFGGCGVKIGQCFWTPMSLFFSYATLWSKVLTL